MISSRDVHGAEVTISDCKKEGLHECAQSAGLDVIIEQQIKELDVQGAYTFELVIH